MKWVLDVFLQKTKPHWSLQNRKRELSPIRRFARHSALQLRAQRCSRVASDLAEGGQPLHTACIRIANMDNIEFRSLQKKITFHLTTSTIRVSFDLLPWGTASDLDIREAQCTSTGALHYHHVLLRKAYRQRKGSGRVPPIQDDMVTCGLSLGTAQIPKGFCPGMLQEMMSRLILRGTQTWRGI